MKPNSKYWLLLAALTTPLLAEGADEGSTPPTTEAAPAGTEEANPLLTASKLRSRVRDMRKQVLGGGPAVQNSEKEALRFYRGKIQEMGRQSDDLRTKRDSKDAEYQVALETTLQSEDPSERGEAAREAQQLRRQIGDLDEQVAAMEKRGESLGRGVESIQRRIDKRKRLVSQFERNDIVEDLPYLEDEVLGGEEDIGGAGSNPFADEGFIQDLLKRDPEAARRLIFDADPAGYWKRFPLKPSAKAVRKLRFPPADLPGKP